MIFENQKSAMDQLKQLGQSDRHSVMIEGLEGCGKTTLAQTYKHLVACSDFTLVEPNVQALRNAIDSCYNISTKSLICIENLDSGVAAASYTILKFLEEPAENIYIVVTCRNRYRIPDTIISRSTVVTIDPPTPQSIIEYVDYKYPDKGIKSHNLFLCIKTFSDVDRVAQMNKDQIDYFQTFSHLDFSESISNMAWKLMHYPDNTDLYVPFVIRYIMNLTHNAHVHRCGVECLDDLSTGRIAAHAVVSKFCMDLKYTE